MSNERIDLTQFEESFGSLLDAVLGGTCTLEDGEGHLHDRMQVILAELKRCYKQNDLLTKAFMMAGMLGCYMTMCEECDDVHTPDDECPFICEHCGEKKCECPASE